MSLKEKVQEDIKLALKNKNQEDLEALRLLSASIKNEEIKKNKDLLSEMDLLSLLKKQIKMYEETAAQAVEASRKEVAEKELNKVEFLKKYLPPAISEEELLRIVKEIIKTKNPTSLKEQGLIIKEVQNKVKGGADNVLIAKLVREQLQQL